MTSALSDLEARFAGKVCGKKGADVRPNFNWEAKGPVGGMGYRVAPLGKPVRQDATTP